MQYSVKSSSGILCSQSTIHTDEERLYSQHTLPQSVLTAMSGLVRHESIWGALIDACHFTNRMMIPETWRQAISTTVNSVKVVPAVMCRICYSMQDADVENIS